MTEYEDSATKPCRRIEVLLLGELVKGATLSHGIAEDT
jgi:hypothetical protein